MTKSQRKFPVPYGLFIALGVYGLAVLGYVWATYWSTPEYAAAKHYATALRILGVDDGRKCSEEQLITATEHVLEAARLMPQEKGLAEHAEKLRWRFEERHFKVPKDIERHAELVSATARRLEQEKDPLLVVGLRDRGWGPEQLLAGPEKVVLWSIPGGVIIIVVWAYLRFSARAVREREHEDELKKAEKEVEELGAFRNRVPTEPVTEETKTVEDPIPPVAPVTRRKNARDNEPTEPDARPLPLKPKLDLTPEGKRDTVPEAPRAKVPTLTSRPALKKKPPGE